jgi:hypothetical protein
MGQHFSRIEDMRRFLRENGYAVVGPFNDGTYAILDNDRVVQATNLRLVGLYAFADNVADAKEESEKEKVMDNANDNIIFIMQGTFGCFKNQHAGIVHDWDATTGDGGSYVGILETVLRRAGESYEDFRKRAEIRVNELDRQLGCPLCYRG